jgi:hypothetical protein
METEVVWALLGVLVTLLGVAVAVIAMQRRDGKNGNPSTGAHLAKLETLGEQQVRALEQMSTELTAIQVTLGKLETTVGSCGAVQQLRQGG